MKKVLILILIILLGVMCYNTIKDGYEIGGFSVLGIGEMQAQNEELDTVIAQAEQLKNTDYLAKLGEISTAAKELQSTKKTYEELIAYSSEQEVLDAAKRERYDVEVLWTRVGNHATANGVVPRMDIVASTNNTPNANDLKFTVTGNYIALTDFIRDIEEDVKLGFTIEEFELLPVTSGDGTNLQATFRVKDIFINAETTTTTVSTPETESKNDTTTNNEGTQQNNETKQENKTEENNKTEQ